MTSVDSTLVKERGVFFGTAALFAFALVCGGLGPHAPLLSGLIQAAAFVLLVAVATSYRAGALARTECLIPLAAVLLLLVVGVGQIVPLPPAIWRELPGRDVPAMVLDSLGEGQSWLPLSLAPEDTRLTILTWLPPITIFIATMMLSISERRQLARIVVSVAAASSVVGLLQRSFGPSFMLYDPGGGSDRLPGLFANINHQALFLACAVALLPSVLVYRRVQSVIHRVWPAAFWCLALLGTLVTASRAGLLLFAMASILTALRLRQRGSNSSTFLSFSWPKASIFLMVVSAGVVAASSYRADQLMARFVQLGEDARYDFWKASLSAIKAYFPEGAGLGTFEAVFQVTEPLETIREFLVNHAHNDIIEVAFETGLCGMLAMAIFVVWVGVRTARICNLHNWRSSASLSASIIVWLVLLHSLVDYPLRTEAIGCVFAFACALVVRDRDDRLAFQQVESDTRAVDYRKRDQPDPPSLMSARHFTAAACTSLLVFLSVGVARAQSSGVQTATRVPKNPGQRIGGDGRVPLGGTGSTVFTPSGAPAIVPNNRPAQKPAESSFRILVKQIQNQADPD